MGADFPHFDTVYHRGTALGVAERTGDDEYTLICAATGPSERASMPRIAAAMNACLGIPSAALEAGVVGKLVDACRGFVESPRMNAADLRAMSDALKLLEAP